jgi:hypothetical protein
VDGTDLVLASNLGHWISIGWTARNKRGNCSPAGLAPARAVLDSVGGELPMVGDDEEVADGMQ